MNKKCRLQDAEEIISNMELSYIADDIAETEEDTQVVVSGYCVVIPELNLQLHEGILCNFDDEEQMFMPDVAVTVVYEVGADRIEYIDFESDGMETSLYNYLGGKKSAEEIANLWCEIVVPEEGEYE